MIELKKHSKTNFHKVEIGRNIAFFFSYEALVAIQTPFEFIVSENIWGPTTGKHINDIDPHKSFRIPGDEFQKKRRGIEEAMEKAIQETIE
jgi:hypothetical protein